MILRTSGNAYKVVDGTLMSAPISIDNTIDENDWFEVDFDRIDDANKKLCNDVKKIIEGVSNA